jgi:predicted permease
MTYFLSILSTVILPIFLLIGAGYGVQRLFHFDLDALKKIIFYLLIPALIFSRLYNTTLSFANFSSLFLFEVALIVVMGLISIPLSRLRRYTPSMRAAFALALMYCNSGNYGIPVVELVFNNNAVANSIQVLVLTAQNILTFSLGVFLISRGSHSFKDSLIKMLKFPTLYAIMLAVLLRVLHISPWEVLWTPIEWLSRALVPVALISLGASLASITITTELADVFIAVIGRLVLGPLIALALIFAFRYRGVVAYTLLVSSSMPTAVNTALLAIEFDNEPRFSSQVVLFATIASMLTVSSTIYFGSLLFGT